MRVLIYRSTQRVDNSDKDFWTVGSWGGWYDQGDISGVGKSFDCSHFGVPRAHQLAAIGTLFRRDGTGSVEFAQKLGRSIRTFSITLILQSVWRLWR
jgi:hypothetical protein